MPRRLLNHLVLHLEDGRRIWMSTEEDTDSMLCNRGRQLMGDLWNKSRVKLARTFVTRIRDV